MEAKVKDYLLDAIRVMMKPLVRLLINQGVTHNDFAGVLKEVYVDSAIRHFGDSEKINQSKVAILTGLTRKEVRATLDRSMEVQDDSTSYSRPERVLSGWFSDPRYQGPYGLPLELHYENGPVDGISFVDLVKTYSGDMSPRAMLKELIRGGSIVEISNGVYKAVRREFEPGALSRELIVRFGEIGHKVFSTAAANIEKKEYGSGYFDRLVYAENGCTDEVIREFNDYVKKHGQEFLVLLDNWISTHEGDNKPDEERKETGVYVVHYVESQEEKSTLGELLTKRGFQQDNDSD